MEQLHFWWAIIPLAALGLAFFGAWLKHKRHIATLELIRSYLAQGKEPAPELLRAVEGDAKSGEGGVLRSWRRATTFGALAAGFGVTYSVMVQGTMSPTRAHPFLVAAIVFGALALGSMVCALMQRKTESK